MKPSQIISTTKSAYAAMQSVFYWGPPGTAKSSCGRQAATDLKVDFIDVRLSIMEPSEMRFMMTVDDKGAMKFKRPFFIPAKGKGIIMLDELVQCAPSMQAAASQLILDRRVGEHVLGDGWLVIGAGNRKSDRAATNNMPTHIANRFVHLTMDVSLDEWVAWALTHNIDIRVIAFLKWREKLLFNFDPQAKGEAFASPRSWEFASKMLTAGIADDCLMDVMKGTVGEGAATEFVGFLRVFEKLPSIDAIILNPGQAVIPAEPAVLYAIASAMVLRATKDNLNKIAKYMDRVKDAGRPEFPVIALKEIALKKPELTNTRAYVEWASSLSSLIA